MSSIQERIIQSFEEKLGEKESIAKWFELAFDIDGSNARRKLSGDSKLTLDQLELMVKERPSLLEVFLPAPLRSNTFFGSYNHIHNFKEVECYLKAIVERFQLATKGDAVLKYVARDLPLFFFLADRDLASYKFSLWTGELQKGRLLVLSDEVYQLCQEAYQLYCELPTIEIWSRDTTVSQYRQLDWHLQMSYISSAQKEALLAVFREQVCRYKNWAELGVKAGAAGLELYFSEFITMNNGGLLQTPQLQVLMSAISNVNFVSYLNPVLCEGFEKEFNEQRNASILVSQSNALERERSFNHLLKALGS